MTTEDRDATAVLDAYEQVFSDILRSLDRSLRDRIKATLLEAFDDHYLLIKRESVGPYTRPNTEFFDVIRRCAGNLAIPAIADKRILTQLSDTHLIVVIKSFGAFLGCLFAYVEYVVNESYNVHKFLNVNTGMINEIFLNMLKFGILTHPIKGRLRKDIGMTKERLLGAVIATIPEVARR